VCMSKRPRHISRESFLVMNIRACVLLTFVVTSSNFAFTAFIFGMDVYEEEEISFA
jgi:hypothetical protein